MTDETIVAVYETLVSAARAAQDLEDSGLPEGAVSMHSGDVAELATTATGSKRQSGFWSSLFGARTRPGLTVHGRSITDGSTLVTATVPAAYVSRTIQILARHAPVELNDGVFGRSLVEALGSGSDKPFGTAADTKPEGVTADPAVGRRTEIIQFGEGRLAPGKRSVNRGNADLRQ